MILYVYYFQVEFFGHTKKSKLQADDPRRVLIQSSTGSCQNTFSMRKVFQTFPAQVAVDSLIHFLVRLKRKKLDKTFIRPKNKKEKPICFSHVARAFWYNLETKCRHNKYISFFLLWFYINIFYSRGFWCKLRIRNSLHNSL